MTLKQNLKRARDLISGGWTQGVYTTAGAISVAIRRPHGHCYCLTGAVIVATDDRERFALPEYEALAAQLPEDFNPDMAPKARLEQWNDKPGRRREDVLDLFDRAIATC